VRRLVRPGATVVVFGADGKSGMLACVHAKAAAGKGGRVAGIAPDRTTAGAQLLLAQGYVDDFLAVDARDALAVRAALNGAGVPEADVVINCVNVPGTELASILCARDEGTIYFFSMSTSFTAAALGAEGVGKDVTMLIGNGFAKGHAEIALQTLRDHPALSRYFIDRYT
jgi:L-erythro-3,5-diaminohexanoate dehydrogenase